MMELLTAKELAGKEAKERERQEAKEAKDSLHSLLDVLKEKLKQIQADYDFLKGTLDARHIIETYEAKFKKPKLTRTEYWKRHLDLNPTIMQELKRCDGNIAWHDKIAEIYDTLSRDIHNQTVDLGNGRYLLIIKKSLPKLSMCFVQAIAKELYGENVTVHAVGDEVI
jgi:hypothetical protein